MLPTDLFAHEEKILGQKPRYLLRMGEIHISDAKPKPAPRKAKREPEIDASDLTPEECLNMYEKTGNATPLIQGLANAEPAAITQLFNTWKFSSKLKRKIEEPELVQAIYHVLYTPGMADVYHFVGLRKLPGYKRALLNLLMQAHENLDEKIRGHIPHFTQGINDLTADEIRQLGEWLTDAAKNDKHAAWIADVLANANTQEHARITEYFEAYLQRFNSQFKNDTPRTIYRYLCRHGHAAHIPQLRYALTECIRAYNEDHIDYRYDDFIRGLARVAGPDAVEDLKNIYDSHQYSAIEGLGIAAQGTGDEALAQWMLTHYKDGTSYWGMKEKYHLTLAVEKITGNPNNGLTDHLYTEAQKKGLETFLNTKGLSNEALIMQLRALDFIGEHVSDETLLDEIEDETFFGIQDQVRHLLQKAGVLVAYDSEAGSNPINYKSVLGYFSQNGKGAFTPWKISQKNSGNSVDQVEFSFGKNHYTFTPDDNEDWIDVDLVAAAVNRALVDNGSNEYFIYIDTGGQDVLYIFGTPEKIARLMSDYNLGRRKPNKPVPSAPAAPTTEPGESPETISQPQKPWWKFW